MLEFFIRRFLVNQKLAQRVKLNKLPEEVSMGTRKRIEEYTKGYTSNFGLW